MAALQKSATLQSAAGTTAASTLLKTSGKWASSKLRRLVNYFVRSVQSDNLSPKENSTSELYIQQDQSISKHYTLH